MRGRRNRKRKPEKREGRTHGFNFGLLSREATGVVSPYSGLTLLGFHVDFGFIEPALLARVMVDSQNGRTLPEQVEGKLVVRVSLGLDVLGRLQGQMQQVFLNIRQAPVNGARSEK